MGNLRNIYDYNDFYRFTGLDWNLIDQLIISVAAKDSSADHHNL